VNTEQMRELDMNKMYTIFVMYKQAFALQ